MSAGDPRWRRTLTLTGVTTNAMALMAPGALLWTTYSLQAALTGPGGSPAAPDIWTGLLLALLVSFATALSYARLARLYPDAGTGSSYAFAERALLERGGTPARLARLAKYAVGWVSHQYYWVYPGVMVAMMAVLVSYVAALAGIALPPAARILVAVLFALLAGGIALRGITASTLASLIVNGLQIAMLIGVTVLGLIYRARNPAGVHFAMPTLGSIVIPHDLTGVLLQSTLAVLLVVGFESATALAAEARRQSFVSRAVLTALIVQGLVCYLGEYFGVQAWVNDGYSVQRGGQVLRGFAAAAASPAPVGDMVRQVVQSVAGGGGTVAVWIVAGCVGAALLGATLACLNTGVRVTFAMSRDAEVPTVLGALHGRFATPHNAVWLLTAVSAAIGSLGALSVRNLTSVVLLSNLGTVMLFGLTDLVALVAPQRPPVRGARALAGAAVPLLGLLGNAGLLAALVYLDAAGVGATGAAAGSAVAGTVTWLLIGAFYLVGNTRARGRAFLGPAPAPAGMAPRPPSGATAVVPGRPSGPAPRRPRPSR